MSGATLDVYDSDGRDALYYAIQLNRITLVNYLLEERQ